MRQSFSDQQINVLERVFKEDPLPRPVIRMQLAVHLGISPRRVQIWFQNRRQRWKTEEVGAGRARPHPRETGRRIGSLSEVLPQKNLQHIVASSGVPSGVGLGMVGGMSGVMTNGMTTGTGDMIGGMIGGMTGSMMATGMCVSGMMQSTSSYATTNQGHGAAPGLIYSGGSVFPQRVLPSQPLAIPSVAQPIFPRHVPVRPVPVLAVHDSGHMLTGSSVLPPQQPALHPPQPVLSGNELLVAPSANT